MFKIAIAHSLTANMEAAAASLAQKALHGLDGHAPGAALLFSTIGLDHAELLARLTPLLPCSVVGGSSYGEVSREQGYRVGSSLLILFASDSVKFHAGVLRGLSFDDEAGNQKILAQQLREGSDDPVLGLLFPDGIGLDGASVVRMFSSAFPTTRFFGGATAENFHLGATHQFFNEEILQHAVPYLLFYGPLRYSWAVTEGLDSGWRAIGARLDATCDGRWIRTIDAKPAIEYLASRYRLAGGLLSVCHPFVIYPNRESDEHYFLDVIRYAADSGALESMQMLPASCQIQLTQPDPAAILEISQRNIHQALGHLPATTSPAGVLWFSCVSRALVLQDDPASEFNSATINLPDALSVAGFYTYGEIAPAGPTGVSAYHSSTLMTLLLAEEPRVDCGIFKDQQQFSVENLMQEKQALAAALETARAELSALQQKMAESQSLGCAAAHSKTEMHMLYRALALELVCRVLDTRFDDFKRLALKGDPPKLNRSGLARLVNEQHLRQWGRPFPLTLPQLARLLAPEHADI